MPHAHGVVHPGQRDICLRHKELHALVRQSRVRPRRLLRPAAELSRRDALRRRSMPERKFFLLFRLLPLPGLVNHISNAPHRAAATATLATKSAPGSTKTSPSSSACPPVSAVCSSSASCAAAGAPTAAGVRGPSTQP